MPYMARIDPFASTTPPKMLSMERLLLNSSPEYSWNVGMQKVRPIGDMTPPSTVAPLAPQSTYRERCLRLRQLEDDKNSLIDDLIRQLESSQQQLAQVQIERDRESRFDREGQLREESLRAELSQIKNLIIRDPYVTVLVDAEAATFAEDLWSRGEHGGIEVAQTLENQVREAALQKLQHLSSVRVQVRAFASFKRLSAALRAANIIEDETTFNNFVQGLNSRLTFDFLDTGTNAGITAQKIMHNFQQQLRNCHCHQIFLAIGSNDEYAKLFEVSTDVNISERVTLIGLTSSKGVLASKYNLDSVRIEDLFHNLALDIVTKPSTKANRPNTIIRRESNVSSNTGASASASSTPGLTWAAMTAQPFVPQVQSGKGARASSPATRSSLSLRAAPEIPRNKCGQRIDAVDNTIPYQELQRIKKMKLCNVYYLQGPSCCNGNCGHLHTYPLKNYEKNILQEVARMTPCYYKLECSDPSCIYGHRCPQSKPGQDDCYYEDKCRFFGWGHGIDEKIVKTTNTKG